MGRASRITQRDLYPHPSSPAVTAVMKGNRRTDTRPERAVRSALYRRGLRFRKEYTVHLPGRRVRVDVAFVGQRVAVFVDGCFWHGCPAHGNKPSVNTQYWTPKLARNVERDHQVSAALCEAGWTVLRFWEHEAAEEVAAVIERVARGLAEV